MASSLGSDNPFRYRGYVYDTETTLYYLQSRYYNPAMGRFISADVYLSTGQGVLGHNAYAYCGNDPVNRRDPSGYQYESVKVYAGTMWWLTVADGPIPVGDILYLVGIGVCAAIDTVNAIGAHNIAVFFDSMLHEGGAMLKDSINKVGEWVKDIFGGGGSPSPGDPNWNGGFNSFRQLKQYLGDAGEGNQWHHIVEQSQIKKSGFDPSMVHNVNNVIKISKELNNKIAAYYNSVDYFLKAYAFGIGLQVKVLNINIILALEC